MAATQLPALLLAAIWASRELATATFPRARFDNHPLCPFAHPGWYACPTTTILRARLVLRSPHRPEPGKARRGKQSAYSLLATRTESDEATERKGPRAARTREPARPTPPTPHLASHRRIKSGAGGTSCGEGSRGDTRAHVGWPADQFPGPRRATAALLFACCGLWSCRSIRDRGSLSGAAPHCSTVLFGSSS
jgi:hypothetical protein